MCSCGDYDSNRVWREQLRRARKEHRCGECGHAIKSGDRYHYGSGISADGDAFDLKWCATCDDRLRALQRAEGDGGCYPTEGELLSTIRECMQEDVDFAAKYLAARRELRRERVAA